MFGFSMNSASPVVKSIAKCRIPVLKSVKKDLTLSRYIMYSSDHWRKPGGLAFISFVLGTCLTITFVVDDLWYAQPAPNHPALWRQRPVHETQIAKLFGAKDQQ